jgi:hypothetical protein
VGRRVIYSDSRIPTSALDGLSLFLAGPTPREASTISWRPEALQILTDLKYAGSVFVPEWSSPSTAVDYLTQVGWERTGLERSTRIVFWVAREMACMPALTTNVEFGFWLARSPERIVYGRPSWAAKCDYLDWLYGHETGRKPFEEMGALLRVAVT